MTGINLNESNQKVAAYLGDEDSKQTGIKANPLSTKQVDGEGEQIGIKDNPLFTETETGAVINLLTEILSELKKIEFHLSLGSDEK